MIDKQRRGLGIQPTTPFIDHTAFLSQARAEPAHGRAASGADYARLSSWSVDQIHARLSSWSGPNSLSHNVDNVINVRSKAQRTEQKTRGTGKSGEVRAQS